MGFKSNGTVNFVLFLKDEFGRNEFVILLVNLRSRYELLCTTGQEIIEFSRDGLEPPFSFGTV